MPNASNQANLNFFRLVAVMQESEKSFIFSFSPFAVDGSNSDNVPSSLAVPRHLLIENGLRFHLINDVYVDAIESKCDVKSAMSFLAALRKHLVGKLLVGVSHENSAKVLRLNFCPLNTPLSNVLSDASVRVPLSKGSISLLASFTLPLNLFLLDHSGKILATFKNSSFKNPLKLAPPQVPSSNLTIDSARASERTQGKKASSGGKTKSLSKPSKAKKVSDQVIVKTGDFFPFYLYSDPVDYDASCARLHTLTLPSGNDTASSVGGTDPATKPNVVVRRRDILQLIPDIFPSLLNHWAALSDVKDVSSSEYSIADLESLMINWPKIRDILNGEYDSVGGYIYYDEPPVASERCPLDFSAIRFMGSTRAVEEFNTFNDAVSCYFTLLKNRQKLRPQLPKEKPGKQQKAKQEIFERLSVLKREIDLDETKAKLLQANEELVTKACQVIELGLAAGLSWPALEQLVESEKRKDNEVALIIDSLQLEKGAITVTLPLDTDSLFFDENIVCEDNVDEPGNQCAADAVDLQIPVFIDQSAHANAQRYYSNRKDLVEKYESLLEKYKTLN